MEGYQIKQGKQKEIQYTNDLRHIMRHRKSNVNPYRLHPRKQTVRY